MQILLFFNNIYVTLRSSKCFEQHAAHHQEDQLYHYSLLYRHPVVFKLLVWCGAEGYMSGLQDAGKPASCSPDT